MTVKSILGNSMIFLASYVGIKTAALATTAVQATTSTEATAAKYMAQFSDTYSLVGFVVPNWWGIVFYVVFLIFGAIASANQPTPVDDKFKHGFLKPFYSLAFGVLVTLFVLPVFYPDITIWALIVPAGFFAAVGAVIIYYVIAFFTSDALWTMLSAEAQNTIRTLLQVATDRAKAVISALMGRGDK